MPMRYCVELARATFYTGLPGYHRVVAVNAGVDLAVIAVLTVALLAAGGALFSYRERVR
jgi:hypothetical protein